MTKDLSKVAIVFLFLIFLSISAVSAQENTNSEVGLNDNAAILEVEEKDNKGNVGISEDNAAILEVEEKDNKGNVGISEDNRAILEVEEKEDTIGVDSNEEILGNGNPGSFKDLQKLINNAKPGDTITLNKDYVYKKGDSRILINKALTINGKNHKIDGKSSTGIFNITGSNVKLKGIKFINANPYEPVYGDGWEADDSFGGAILWIGHNGYVDSCKFINNRAVYGSAISWQGNNGILYNSLFERNFDSEAIRWSGNNGKLLENTFQNNYNKYHLISIDGNNYDIFYNTLKFNTFINNNIGSEMIASDGGDPKITINNCLFIDNSIANLEYGFFMIDDDDDINESTFYIYRDINNPDVKVPNLFYNRDKNYAVDYYENGKKIASGKLHDGIVFKNLNINSHFITMKYTNSKGKVITHYLQIYTKGTYLNANNIVMFKNDGTQYILRVTNYNGVPLANKRVAISIFRNGEFSGYYYKTTDAKGYIKLPIKKKAGNYNIFASCMEGSSWEGVNIPISIKTTLKILKSPITQNKDLKIFYLGGTFKVKIIKLDGKPVGAGKVVKFTIAGKTYTKKTNKNGWVYLKIKLKPKKYTITTQYGKFKAKNEIVVKPLLIANNIVKKKASIIKFKVKLVNSKGKPQAKKRIRVKIKGKTYKLKTNKNGIATLKIKNLKKGKYNIYTRYGVSKIKNTIRIK
ncbi:right-handed parallel beta-helix repeat-containing protein [Methanobrevibacter olleyae]|uniref:Adhesin-like protein n=1 Tax=Methanobrevibacter olleyae TaxID=294671 RepID=A0A126QZJ6_METOL|nr:hypothetical protein [Methanobrevibacter olleyae]AMK15550.1 adhesin-like protein [Methanobrevibacter olleyae]